MKVLRFSASAAVAVAVAVAMILAHAPNAESAPPPSPFEVAYRAWDVVMEIARHNGDPSISGECGRTFRPFVIPGLRRQTLQEEEATAATCLEAARSACMNSELRRSAGVARKCDEFR